MTELSGLPAISPAEAHLRQTVPAALSGRRAGGGVVIARFVTIAGESRGWFRCEDGIFLAIERLGGIDRRISPDDGVEAAELIEAAEPLVRVMEVGLNIAIEPSEIVQTIPTDHLVAEVTAVRAGATHDRLLLALPPDIELVPAAPPPPAPELLGSIHLPATIAIAGPRVAPHDAADLAHGDLLLLGAGPLQAKLSIGDAWSVTGRFDPVRRCFETGQTD